jgi:Domain of unknown function DUF302
MARQKMTRVREVGGHAIVTAIDTGEYGQALGLHGGLKPEHRIFRTVIAPLCYQSFHCRPTDLQKFGNAKGGTPLIQAAQTIGIDLPLKIPVWQDAAGATWLSYNDPGWLAERHGLSADVEATVSALTIAIHAAAKAAAGSQ